MPATDASPQTLLDRPKRADARRNYEKVLAAAREAFAEGGESTALEEIARRAGVGIGTLYRHFPNRQALLEALYVGEVEDICRIAAELDGTDPWEALSRWSERFIAYMATKQALAGSSSTTSTATTRCSRRAAARCTTRASRCSRAPRRRASSART